MFDRNKRKMLPKEETSPLKNISVGGGKKILSMSLMENMVLMKKYRGMIARPLLRTHL